MDDYIDKYIFLCMLIFERKLCRRFETVPSSTLLKLFNVQDKFLQRRYDPSKKKISFKIELPKYITCGKRDFERISQYFFI